MSDDLAEAVTKTAQLNVLSQYVRELTFDNVAGKSGVNPSGKPDINVSVNVDNRKIGDNRYVVGLGAKISAETGDGPIFHVNLDYVGVFQLSGVPEDAVTAVLSIECPRLLFPFSRRIIAETTRDGGYPPLLLDPIDFASLYRQQMAQRADAEIANGQAGSA